MKKSILLPMLGFLLLFVTSCNWQVPQKVSVKTQAEYEFSLGDALFSAIDTEKIFGEFNLKSMISEGISIQNSQVYDYLPRKNEDVQKFIIKIPVQRIPINFSEYMNDSDFATAMNEMQVDDTVIEIPAISDSNTTASIDLDSLHTGLSVLISASDSASSSTAPLSYVAISAGKGNFTSIKIKSGYYLVKGDFSNNTSVRLITGSKSTETAYFSNKEAKINIAGFEFTPSTQIVFQNGSGSYTAVADPSSKFEIAAAKNVTYVEGIPVAIDPLDFSVISSEDAKNFVEAQIKEGQVNVDLQYDKNWTGITAEYDVTLTGSLSIPKQRTKNVVNLADKTISGTEKTRLAADAYLSLKDANLEFTSNSAISIVATSSVSSFNYVIVTFSDSESLSKSSEAELPEEFMKTVKMITLLSSGISGNYINTLPDGNDIKMEISSNFLGLDNSATLTAGTEKGNYSVKSEDNFKADRNIGTGAGDFNKIDYNVRIVLPGSTQEHPEWIKLSNVKPNDSYTISIKINPDIDYEKMTIDTSDYNQKDVQELGLNLSSLFSELEFGGVNIGEKLTLKSLPVYIMAMKPEVKSQESGKDLFSEAKFRGKISLFMGKEGTGADAVPVKDSEGDINIDLLGSSAQAGVLAFGRLPSLEIENETINVKFNEVMGNLVDQKQAIGADLTSILNREVSSDDSLYLSYEMEFTNGDGANSNLTIYKNQLDTSEDATTSIEVVAFIELPLEFNVSEDVNLKVVESEEAEEANVSDQGEKDEKIEMLTSVIKDAKIEITPTALPFIANPPMELNLRLASQIEENVIFGVGVTKTISINGSKVNSLIDVISNGAELSPNVQLKLSKGTIAIPRKMDFKANVVLGLRTDGKIELYPELGGGN